MVSSILSQIWVIIQRENVSNVLVFKNPVVLYERDFFFLRLTVHFTIQEPQNPLIGEFHLVPKRRSTDFKDKNKRQVRSGRSHTSMFSAFIHSRPSKTFFSLGSVRFLAAGGTDIDTKKFFFTRRHFYGQKVFHGFCCHLQQYIQPDYSLLESPKIRRSTNFT